MGDRELNPERAEVIEIPDALDTDALAAFLETNTEYRIWYDSDGDPLLVELAEKNDKPTFRPQFEPEPDIARDPGQSPLDLAPEREPGRGFRNDE